MTWADGRMCLEAAPTSASPEVDGRGEDGEPPW